MLPFQLILPLLCSEADTPATVCTCRAEGTVRAQVQAAFERAHVVFAGKVVGFRYVVAPLRPEHAQDSMMFNLAIMVPERHWKGPASDTLVIWTPDDAGVCGFPFQEGESYLVFARKPDAATLTTGLCDLTRLMALAEEHLLALGKPRRP